MQDDNNDITVQTYEEPLDNIDVTHERKTEICWHDIKLNNQAEEAIKKKKIFQIYGNGTILRKVLIERGWIEKKLNIKNDLCDIKRKDYKDRYEMLNAIEACHLSNLVKNSVPNFVFNANGSRSRKITSYQQSPTVVYNTFKLKPTWTVAQELCALSKNSTWYYIENVAEVNIPRTYISYDQNEKDEFILNYKLTACVNVLKYVLSRAGKFDEVFNVSGNIDLQIFLFAINKCKEFLFQKQHDDIDRSSITEIKDNQWNLFLENYYILIEDKSTFQLDSINKPRIPLYLDLSKLLLQQIQCCWPGVNCEGYRNIWIAKPTCLCPGLGTKIISRLNKLCQLFKNSKFVVQKYIEKSLLIHERKFSIKQFFLVTNTFPLEIWMHEECHLKFSDNVQNSDKGFDDISNDQTNPLQGTILNFKAFMEYLQRQCKENKWETVINPGMRKSFVGFMLSLQHSLLSSKNCYELFRCDFILDQDYQPWLVKIVRNPNLDINATKTAEIYSTVLFDLLKVVVDRVEDIKAETGKFWCVYSQAECVPYLRKSNSFIIRGSKLTIAYMRKQKAKDDLVEIYQNPNMISPDVKTLLRELKIKHKIDNNFPLIPKFVQKNHQMVVANVKSSLPKPSNMFFFKPAQTKQKLQRYKGSKAHVDKNKKQHNQEESILLSNERFITIDALSKFYPRMPPKVKSTKKLKGPKKQSCTDSCLKYGKYPKKYADLPEIVKSLKAKHEIYNNPYDRNITGQKSCLIKKSENESSYISQPHLQRLLKSGMKDIELTSVSNSDLTYHKNALSDRKKSVQFSDSQPFEPSPITIDQKQKMNTSNQNHNSSPQIRVPLSILNASYLYTKHKENGQELNSCTQSTAISSEFSSSTSFNESSYIVDEKKYPNQKLDDGSPFQTSKPILNANDIQNNKCKERDISYLSSPILDEIQNTNPTATTSNDGRRYRTALPILNATYLSYNFKEPVHVFDSSYAQTSMAGEFQNCCVTSPTLNNSEHSQEKLLAPKLIYVSCKSKNHESYASNNGNVTGFGYRKALPILNATYLKNEKNSVPFGFEHEVYQSSAAIQTESFISLSEKETITSFSESENIEQVSSSQISLQTTQTESISVSTNEKDETLPIVDILLTKKK